MSMRKAKTKIAPNYRDYAHQLEIECDNWRHCAEDLAIVLFNIRLANTESKSKTNSALYRFQRLRGGLEFNPARLLLARSKERKQQK